MLCAGLQEDLMNETIDDALADEEDEEQEDMIVGQVRPALLAGFILTLHR